MNERPGLLPLLTDLPWAVLQRTNVYYNITVYVYFPLVSTRFWRTLPERRRERCQVHTTRVPTYTRHTRQGGEGTSGRVDKEVRSSHAFGTCLDVRCAASCALSTDYSPTGARTHT